MRLLQLLVLMGRESELKPYRLVDSQAALTCLELAALFWGFFRVFLYWVARKYLLFHPVDVYNSE